MSAGEQTIWTPQAIEARVEALDNAWQSLDATSRVAKTRAERRAFLAWRSDFEKRGWFEHNFASSVIPEIERWEKRYEAVRKAEVAAGNGAAGDVPSADDLRPPDVPGALVQLIEGVVILAGAAFVAAIALRVARR